MSDMKESPIITIERRKAMTIIISAIIVSIALGYGLVKVGAGFAARTTDGITVTGSAKVAATADNAVWTLSIQESKSSVAASVKQVGVSIDALSAYLTKGGIPADSIQLGAVSTYANQEYKNGNPTGRTLSYNASRNLTVRSKDVQLIAQLSQDIGTLLQTGVNINNYGPQYYVSTLPTLRPQLLEDAMKDAQVRAIALTRAVGGTIGPVLSVRSGPFQVTTPDSTITSDYGEYDTSTIEKTVTSTVSVTFKTKK
ncbi:MAG TPA: SIMPL domain-containing protein [Candidatus Paceibacterota bacterium]|nr:SIMPL domain-containing protein [Candidatus Paceibacterota bacterium]